VRVPLGALACPGAFSPLHFLGFVLLFFFCFFFWLFVQLRAHDK
jgi:hypothetical protein